MRLQHVQKCCEQNKHYNSLGFSNCSFRGTEIDQNHIFRLFVYHELRIARLRGYQVFKFSQKHAYCARPESCSCSNRINLFHLLNAVSGGVKSEGKVKTIVTIHSEGLRDYAGPRCHVGRRIKRLERDISVSKFSRQLNLSIETRSVFSFADRSRKSQV